MSQLSNIIIVKHYSFKSVREQYLNTILVKGSMRKDHVPTKIIEMNAMLLERLRTEARAIVLPDLFDVQLLLESDNLKC